MLLRHFWPYLWALVKSLVTPSKWWMSPELSGCSRVTFQQCWHLSAPEPPSTTSGAPVGQGAMNSSTVRRNAKYCPGAHEQSIIWAPQGEKRVLLEKSHSTWRSVIFMHRQAELKFHDQFWYFWSRRMLKSSISPQLLKGQDKQTLWWELPCGILTF